MLAQEKQIAYPKEFFNFRLFPGESRDAAIASCELARTQATEEAGFDMSIVSQLLQIHIP